MDPQTLPQVLHKEVSGEKEQEREISLAEIIGLPDFDVSAAHRIEWRDNVSELEPEGIGLV